VPYGSYAMKALGEKSGAYKPVEIWASVITG